MIDQIAGQVQCAFNTAIGVIPQVQAGKLKALAISARERFPAMLELPSVEVAGVKGFDDGSWQGVVMPTSTPRDIVAKTNEELVKMLKAPDSGERLLRLGGLPGGNTPEEFAAYVKVEQEKWGKVAKAAKIQVD